MGKTVFKIRRKSDGLFSTGGYSPSFTKKGKTWPSKGALHTHLNFEPKSYSYTPSNNPFAGNPHVTHDAYADCELVEIEIVEQEKGTIDVPVYRENRRRELYDKAQKEEAIRVSKIKKCPTCSHPLNTHRKGAH